MTELEVILPNKILMFNSDHRTATINLRYHNKNDAHVMLTTTPSGVSLNKQDCRLLVKELNKFLEV